MAQTGSTLFNNFVSSLTPKKPTTSAPIYPTPTGNAPIPLRNDRQAVGYATTPPPTARNNFTNNFGKPITSNTGATSTVPTTINPPNSTTSVLPPSGQQYAQNLTQNNGYSTIPGPYDTATGKLKDTTGNTSSGNGSPSSTDTSGNSPTSSTITPPESPYLAYLKSMFDPEQLKTASINSTSANQKLADIQNEEESANYTARREKESLLDRSGTGVGANESAANESIRRNSPALADLALRESAAARSASVYKDTYDTLLNAGKSVYEAETAAKKAEQDQKNEDRKLGQTDTQLQQTADKNKADQALAEKKFDEDRREFGLNYALDARKVAIEQQKANQTDPNSSTTKAKNATDAATSMNLINALINNPSTSKISGYIDQFAGALYPSSNAQLARNQFNQVKGMLSLENRGKLKGQGAVSDFEGRILESAASSLDRNLGDAEFINQLKQIRGAIATSHGLSTEVLVKNPKTNESQAAEADSGSIAKMIQDGLLVTYQ